MEIFDCIIVGGGPAGLNAGVVLGRCRRKVLLFDTETYRNKYSHGMHNYLTRDDIPPADFLKLSHAELEKYSVQKVRKHIISAKKNDDGIFEVHDEFKTAYYSKKLLVATGLSDNVPDIPGFREFYGKSVHHCPYCDGWEVRDKKLGVYARDKDGHELALSLLDWSPNVTMYIDGKKNMKKTHIDILAANQVKIDARPIASIAGTGSQLEKIVFKDGAEDPCDSLFFVNGYNQQCNLAATFDCVMSTKGVVVTNKVQQTNIEGLYVAGDASKDMHFVVVAAAEGAKAAVTINKELQKERILAAIKASR